MKNKGKLFLIFLFTYPLVLFAQIGIGTSSPKTTLDVNGTVNIANEIRLRDNNQEKGSSGKKGDLIAGHGLLNNNWLNFDLPKGYLDGYSLTNSYVLSTYNGIQFTSGSSVSYDKNMAFNTNWKKITDIKKDISVAKAKNIITVSVQTLAQTSNQNGSFACGIYIDNQLKFVRLGTVNPGAGNYRTLNLNATFTNLPIGNHTIEFACSGRNIPNGTTINIGQPIANNTMLNSEMAKTSSTILILEDLK